MNARTVCRRSSEPSVNGRTVCRSSSEPPVNGRTMSEWLLSGIRTRRASTRVDAPTLFTPFSNSFHALRLVGHRVVLTSPPTRSTAVTLP